MLKASAGHLNKEARINHFKMFEGKIYGQTLKKKKKTYVFFPQILMNVFCNFIRFYSLVGKKSKQNNIFTKILNIYLKAFFVLNVFL